MLEHLARFSPVADGVFRLTTVFVNCYAVEVAGGWVLVDTGVPGAAAYIRTAARRRFGSQRPLAIILTHGHFDHAGNAKTLAAAWDVPIYAPRLELPYLTGQSDYPPQDPTPGGALCFLSRFFPHGAVTLGPHLRQMPDDYVPEMTGWRAIATPGHSIGHISLFRESDRVLISGDALATTNLDAWSAQFTWPRGLYRPPTPFTPDWPAAFNSVDRLAELSPATIAPGHGLSVASTNLPERLRAFAEQMRATEAARYSTTPPEFDETGALVSVPPPVPDPLGWQLKGVAIVASLGVGMAIASRLQKRRQDS